MIVPRPYLSHHVKIAAIYRLAGGDAMRGDIKGSVPSFQPGKGMDDCTTLQGGRSLCGGWFAREKSSSAIACGIFSGKALPFVPSPIQSPRKRGTRPLLRSANA